MRLIRSGLALSKTFRSMGRFQEILSILARNGFDGLISQSGLAKGIPDFVLPRATRRSKINEADSSWAATMGQQLRKSFEELGPGFVKLGQVLATREDVFPMDFIVEMRRLQDQARGIAFSEAMLVLSQALGRDYQEVFAELDPDPIGQASIGVVYRAHLKSGEDVVIKIRRPEIIKNIRVDFDILSFIVHRLEAIDPDIRYLGLSRLVEEQARSLENELNFNIEKLSLEKMRRFLDEHDPKKLLHVPRVYTEYSNTHVLVMERIEGIPFTRTEELLVKLANQQELVEYAVDKLLRVLFIEGFFHADLHPGNLFLLPDEKIALIDFGLCGHLSKEMRQSLMVMVYCLSEGLFQQLVHEFLEIAEYEGAPDTRRLALDLQDALSPYVGLPIREMDIGRMIRTSLRLIAQNRIYLPLEFTALLRSLATLDGVAKSLRVDLDLFQIIRSNLTDFLRHYLSFDELAREGLWLGRDLAATMRTLPQNLRRFLREWTQRNYAFEVVHRGLEDELRRLQHGIIFLGSCFLGAGLTIAAVLLAIGAPGRLPDGWNLGVLSLLGLALVVVVWGISSIMRS
ncbi:MAG: ABC1 kinase family protein [Oligoflexus sp.]